ncbi:hypothetical protein ROA7450_03371 [Roseovarius albus]|uniref:Uncharacterized protein n=1 Tax=Roseovarius albus TaxID=1247867 RepID=A0A1X6ZWX2_9RHOB|nr:hypothetical protein ROA7450_03371 [Roseovarius albus]
MRRLLINAAIVVVILSAPIALFFMGWGLLQVYHQMGMIAFLGACVSYFIGSLGLASLVDKGQARQNPPPHDQ